MINVFKKETHMLPWLFLQAVIQIHLATNPRLRPSSRHKRRLRK
jgi:hypothetical protein